MPHDSPVCAGQKCVSKKLRCWEFWPFVPTLHIKHPRLPTKSFPPHCHSGYRITAVSLPQLQLQPCPCHERHCTALHSWHSGAHLCYTCPAACFCPPAHGPGVNGASVGCDTLFQALDSASCSAGAWLLPAHCLIAWAIIFIKCYGASLATRHTA